jgi:hypothetical protein
MKTIISAISLAIAIAGGVMSISSTLLVIPGLDPAIAHLWPQVLAAATLVDRIGNIIIAQLNAQPKP